MMRNVTPATLVLCFALFMGHASWAQPETPSGGNYPAGQAGIDFNVNNAKNNKEASGSAFGRTETFITWASSKMATLLASSSFSSNLVS